MQPAGARAWLCLDESEAGRHRATAKALQRARCSAGRACWVASVCIERATWLQRRSSSVVQRACAWAKASCEAAAISLATTATPSCPSIEATWWSAEKQ